MPKSMSKLVAVFMALTGLVGWGLPGAAAAPGTSAPNVVQVDLVDDWACPVGSSPTTIPDLRLSITTSGGPLMVGLNLNIQNPLTQIEADALITPLIDDIPRTADMLRFQIPHGEDRAGFGVFAFSRLYPVPPGAYTVSWEAACLSQLTVLRGWLTVYELPPVKK